MVRAIVAISSLLVHCFIQECQLLRTRLVSRSKLVVREKLAQLTQRNVCFLGIDVLLALRFRIL